MPWELGAFTAIILLFNLPLLGGSPALNMIFLPGEVAAGDWWRVFTHPFVHVSWYHLLLDATAFLMLYHGLHPKTPLARLGSVLACGAGSLLVSLWAAPMIHAQGLCGLSGIAHGLMAISSVGMLANGRENAIRRAGLISFVLVVAKCVVEAVTGQVMFANLHLGPLGSPVAVCHAGGVLGGLLGWMFISPFKSSSGPEGVLPKPDGARVCDLQRLHTRSKAGDFEDFQTFQGAAARRAALRSHRIGLGNTPLRRL